VLALGAFAPTHQDGPCPALGRTPLPATPDDSRDSLPATPALPGPHSSHHLPSATSATPDFRTHSRGSRISPGLIPGSLRTPRTHHRYQSDWVPILLRVPELSPVWYSFLLHTCLPRSSPSSAMIILSFYIQTLVLMCYIAYQCSYASSLVIQSQSCT
jgi:hypothetical protein